MLFAVISTWETNKRVTWGCHSSLPQETESEIKMYRSLGYFAEGLLDLHYIWGSESST